MSSNARYQCIICDTSMAPSRVDLHHKDMCVSCELMETVKDILAEATTIAGLTPDTYWLDNVWKPYMQEIK